MPTASVGYTGDAVEETGQEILTRHTNLGTGISLWGEHNSFQSLCRGQRGKRLELVALRLQTPGWASADPVNVIAQDGLPFLQGEVPGLVVVR